MTHRIAPRDLVLLTVDQVDSALLEDFCVVRSDADLKEGYDRLEEWLSRKVALEFHTNRSIHTTVALFDGQVVGYVATHVHEIDHRHKGVQAYNPNRPYPALQVKHLAVHAPFEGRGVAGHLLKSAIAKADGIRKITGCRFVYLDALRPAITFYEHHKFILVPKKEPEIGKSPVFTPMIYDLAKAANAVPQKASAPGR